MEVIVVGAGAVGAVVGSLLQQDGHRVHFWTREEAARPRVIQTQRLDGPRLSIEPHWISASSPELPASDWVLVCVRTEQLSAALAEVAQGLGSERAIAIATVTIEGALAVAREAGMTGPVLALHVSFGSGAVQPHGHITGWFPFIVPTAVSAECHAQQLPAAKELAEALRHAGLPTRAVSSMAGEMRLLLMGMSALLPAWELCAWDIARLARDRELRRLTAGAMHETVRTFSPEQGLPRVLARITPRLFYVLLLLVLPWLMNRRAQALWHVHGPKVAAQTRFVARELLARAPTARSTLPHLDELHARLAPLTTH